MSVAKYENLEILSIVKCMRLHLNVVPYLSVARHGCKKLKLIDCRFNSKCWKFKLLKEKINAIPTAYFLAIFNSEMRHFGVV